MSPESLVAELKQLLSEKLKSIILYGSSASGDFIQGVSGHNVLLVADPLGVQELGVIAPITNRWEKAGHPAPQLMTPAELATSADVFPIEIQDMQRSRKVLWGEDLLANLQVDSSHLRMQLEHDLRSKLLFYRQRYLQTCQSPKNLSGLLVSSLSTFLVLFRAALTLYDEGVPLCKVEALQKLAKHLRFDPQPFETVWQWKTQQNIPQNVDVKQLARDYLSAIERVVMAVDMQLHPKKT
ncbi:MAG: hypothetical protein ACO1RA_22645 [Planctomycetaceae bacterium]